MLRRYPDAIRTFATILNFIMRMRQYHTRSYQYDQVSYTFSISNTIPYPRLVDQQDCGQDVCFIRGLPCPFAKSIG